ncbi:cathepsin L-like proteinase [Diabrotica virgifera virgifera]|uniref:Cathepsin L-like proteinase n=1 Tax=Diabrotica virgifera virgifera TaxID=50390 RepID=A0ABM5L4T7_DIAVI|nr:cathepsin L-like proteinase [Diabrotica virgifera virgifera]
MKLLLVIACLIAGITADLNDYDQYVLFKAKHSKQYRITEDKLRFQIFQNNLREIEEHNARYAKGEVGWFKGVTPFADWTKEEFKALLTRQAASKPKLTDNLGSCIANSNVTLPLFVDWRFKDAVLPVRDQGQCGSCWAFSVVGALEGQVAIHQNQRVPLSPQYLNDCSKRNNGCSGGMQEDTFEDIQSIGICADADYPYVAQDQDCRTDVKKAISSISGYKKCNPTEEDLISAVATVGPISSTVDASTWSLYAGGILDDTNCGDWLNHAVLAVGYTDDYILIKNSWGEDWGEEGYIKLARGHNICAINEDNSYPVL